MWPNLNFLFKLFDPKVPQRSLFQKQLPKVILWFILSIHSLSFLSQLLQGRSFFKRTCNYSVRYLLQDREWAKVQAVFLYQKTQLLHSVWFQEDKCSLEVSGTEWEVRRWRKRGLQAKGIQKQGEGVDDRGVSCSRPPNDSGSRGVKAGKFMYLYNKKPMHYA